MYIFLLQNLMNWCMVIFGLNDDFRVAVVVAWPGLFSTVVNSSYLQ